jgi:hypothetical protein
MNYFYSKILSLKKRSLPPNKNFILNPDKVIVELLDSGEPALISRLGGVETLSIIEFRTFASLRNHQISRLKKNAGFFINNETDLDSFVSLNINSLKRSDLLAYWDCPGQFDLFNDLDLDVQYTTLKSYEPFWTANNWISTMKKKNICIVSPFIETMKKQISSLNKIHANLDMQKHNYSFVLAPQTNGSYKHSFDKPSWFQRLDIMKEKILKKEPDLVLIGAGSYGPPLGSILKDLGISSMVCGGALQLYFGILGKRWEERDDYSKIFNDYWTRVSNDEIPDGHKLIEDGCYW